MMDVSYCELIEDLSLPFFKKHELDVKIIELPLDQSIKSEWIQVMCGIQDRLSIFFDMQQYHSESCEYVDQYINDTQSENHPYQHINDEDIYCDAYFTDTTEEFNILNDEWPELSTNTKYQNNQKTSESSAEYVHKTDDEVDLLVIPISNDSNGFQGVVVPSSLINPEKISELASMKNYIEQDDSYSLSYNNIPLY